MAALDAEDIDRIERMDNDLLRRRIVALAGLPMARGSADWRFVTSMRDRAPELVTPDERYRVAELCWAWRKRNLPRLLAPRVNPDDPLSPDMLARDMGCTPTVAAARMERS